MLNSDKWLNDKMIRNATILATLRLFAHTHTHAHKHTRTHTHTHITNVTISSIHLDLNNYISHF